MSRLTHAELAAAYDRQDWKLLWEQAVPLVKFSVSLVARARQLEGRHITDDLLQEGYLAAHAAIRRWDAFEGAFSSFVVRGVRHKLRHHIAREANGLVGGRDAHVARKPFNEEQAFDPAPGFLDPAVQAEHDGQWTAIRVAILGLHHEEQEVVRALYGIDQREETPDELAARIGITTKTVTRRKQRAFRQLSLKLENPV